MGEGHDAAKPEPPSAAEHQKETSWWRQPATIIPIVISIVAVAFTGLTYWDQHRTDLSAITASKRQGASLVSVYPAMRTDSYAIVQNLGQQAIHNAVLNVQTIISPPSSHKHSVVLQAAQIYVGFVPPCSTGQIPLNHVSQIGAPIAERFYHISKPQAIRLLERPQVWFVLPESMIFTDASSNSWVVDVNTGTLNPHAPARDAIDLPGIEPKFAAANGCS